MNGREERKLNDLFFVCSLIEYVGRKTKNERKVVVNTFGARVWSIIMSLMRCIIVRISTS